MCPTYRAIYEVFGSLYVLHVVSMMDGMNVKRHTTVNLIP